MCSIIFPNCVLHIPMVFSRFSAVVHQVSIVFLCFSLHISMFSMFSSHFPKFYDVFSTVFPMFFPMSSPDVSGGLGQIFRPPRCRDEQRGRGDVVAIAGCIAAAAQLPSASRLRWMVFLLKIDDHLIQVDNPWKNEGNWDLTIHNHYD